MKKGKNHLIDARSQLRRIDMIPTKKLKHRIGDAVAILAVGVALTPVVVVGAGIVWTGLYSYLAVREVIHGQ